MADAEGVESGVFGTGGVGDVDGEGEGGGFGVLAGEDAGGRIDGEALDTEDHAPAVGRSAADGFEGVS